VDDLEKLRAALDGDLLTPASPGYDTARQAWLTRVVQVHTEAKATFARLPWGADD